MGIDGIKQRQFYLWSIMVVDNIELYNQEEFNLKLSGNGYVLKQPKIPIALNRENGFLEFKDMCTYNGGNGDLPKLRVLRS